MGTILIMPHYWVNFICFKNVFYLVTIKIKKIFYEFLGDIKRDKTTGDIISAKSANHAYVTKINPDAIGTYIFLSKKYIYLQITLITML